MDACMAVYWGRVNDDMFETFLNTFRKHSNALLQVYSDDLPDGIVNKYSPVKWINVPKEKIKGCRALCKIESLRDFVRTLKNGDRVLVSDVDVYFLDDPFIAFEKDFDLAVTTRSHKYFMPVNGGIYFLRVNDNTRKWLDFRVAESRKPQWDTYVKIQKKIRPSYNPDWGIGQDFLWACWKDPEYIKDRFGVSVVDVGFEYNYCPSIDVFGKVFAGELIKAAYIKKSVKVLHLKSQLKLAIFDGYMEDAITTNLNGRWRWK